MSTAADLPTGDPGAAVPAPTGPVFGLLNCVALADRAPLEALLAARGYTVLRLDGAAIRDKATLLARAAVDLPPVADLTPGNWDALADYLRNVLLDLGTQRVALLWTGADRIAGSDLQDLLDALQVLRGVAEGALRWSPRPVTLLSFLVGDGPQFRRLDAAAVSGSTGST